MGSGRLGGVRRLAVRQTTLKRINLLIRDIQRSPFAGIGKPEPLKHQLSGYWARRIDDEHRLVYRVENDEITIAQCGGHYSPHCAGFLSPLTVEGVTHPITHIFLL